MSRLLLMALLPFSATACAAAAASLEPAPARRAELVNMVRQDCGSCHGMRFKGGLGPPLLPDDLRGKPVDGLVLTVLDGRPGTAMAGWRPFMSEAEARWIVQKLMSGFPELEARGQGN
ncbi:MAG: cytochrome c [Rhodocyclaceae bacterium]|nr:cytochrome c [Rhodocyclaceae bacterium]MBX3668666.1 cytochrome c [Rhodocyclaceae bacterium]